jgi:hypothetical protein
MARKRAFGAPESADALGGFCNVQIVDIRKIETARADQS